MRYNEAGLKLCRCRKSRCSLLKRFWMVQRASVNRIHREAYGCHSSLEFPPALCLQIARMLGQGTQRNMREARFSYQTNLLLDRYAVVE